METYNIEYEKFNELYIKNKIDAAIESVHKIVEDEYNNLKNAYNSLCELFYMPESTANKIRLINRYYKYGVERFNINEHPGITLSLGPDCDAKFTNIIKKIKEYINEKYQTYENYRQTINHLKCFIDAYKIEPTPSIVKQIKIFLETYPESDFNYNTADLKEAIASMA